MNYEEKYKEDLEAAKGWLAIAKENNNNLAIQILEKLFPELRESEDERIKRCIGMCLTDVTEQRFEEFNTTLKDCLAWLEKQGEQKSVVKIEPIKEGLTDFQRCVSCLIASVMNKEYDYTQGFVEWAAQTLLGYAKHEFEKQGELKTIEQDTETRDLWEYIGEWRDKFGRLPKDEDELADCIYYVMKRQKPADMIEPKFKPGDNIIEKDLDECGSGTIKEIKNNKYYFTSGTCIDIQEQDLWQLVKEHVEPKFKVGDWVVDKLGHVWHINSFDKKNYNVSNGDKYNYFPISKQNEMHLWTINDAEDGDVIANKDGAIFINAGSNGGGTFDCYCYLSVQNKFCIEEHKTGSWFYKDDTKPATKKQRDTLFAKMSEAGYEWDPENKELKKIEQNSAWSEEDERNLKGIVTEIEANKNDAPDYDLATYDRFLSWLKSLKDRVQSQQEQDADWLMTLKPHWKPSEEQMKWLKDVIETVPMTCRQQMPLESLYNDLKKL